MTPSTGGTFDAIIVLSRKITCVIVLRYSGLMFVMSGRGIVVSRCITVLRVRC